MGSTTDGKEQAPIRHSRQRIHPSIHLFIHPSVRPSPAEGLIQKTGQPPREQTTEEIDAKKRTAELSCAWATFSPQNEGVNFIPSHLCVRWHTFKDFWNSFTEQNKKGTESPSGYGIDQHVDRDNNKRIWWGGNQRGNDRLLSCRGDLYSNMTHFYAYRGFTGH